MESNAEETSPEVDIKYVPVVNQLTDIYLDTAGSIKSVHEKRYCNTVKRFKQIYEQEPEFLVRAPGRANIIGEHIDYCGYGVFPFALEQDFVIAYSITSNDEIRINNIDMVLFPEQIISTDPYQRLNEEPWWSNYFLAGYKSVMCSAEAESLYKSQKYKPKGMNLFIDSNVPIEAGVSSSAAFWVCVAILAMHANGLIDKIDMKKLTGYVVNGERLVGTACGGMDQTISIMGEMGWAKYIEFNPELRSTTVAIPDGYKFVISNSLTPCAKVATLATRYNMRVVECRIATILLSIAHDKQNDVVNPKTWPYKTMYELQHANQYDDATFLELIESTLK